MIKSFKCKETEKIFNRTFTKKIPHELHRASLRKLRMIHRAQPLLDLRNPPSNRLKILKGKRKGQYSIRINDQWRIRFFWHGKDAEKVEITDYH
ncbi:MAG: type II toxin-antitoxin system RelE/ParE family toxin [Candidatus Marinimicrobia bacterium]|nr:type II toxin-antitoxin system RelE/ParE family toxin [Candidatus Neomarinimicrobiota bacterium]